MGDVLKQAGAEAEAKSGNGPDAFAGGEPHSHDDELNGNGLALIGGSSITETFSNGSTASEPLELSNLLAQTVTTIITPTDSSDMASSEISTSDFISSSDPRLGPSGETFLSIIPLDSINQSIVSPTESIAVSGNGPISITGTTADTISNTVWISDTAGISNTVAITTGGFISDVVESQSTESPEIRANRTVRVPILMYHYLSVPPADADIYRLDLSVKPEQFALHLDSMLDNGYTTISLYELWDHLENGAKLPENPVILTFDDGYQDNYDNAFPLLIQRGMTATFFVVTEFLETNRPGYFTWEMAQEMFDAGMSIESHGINHWSLENRDDDFLIFQALRTKELIEARIGHEPRFISYPAGEYDEATVRIFESANYLMGVTTIQGSTHSNERMFELHRVRVRGTTDADTLLELLTLDW